MKSNLFRPIILAFLMFSVFQTTSCTKKESTDLPSGWSNSELNEVSQWHFENVSSKAQTMADRGDNAKKEFSKCWAMKMAHEYTYSEYKKAYDDFDTYSKKNPTPTNIQQVNELENKIPFFRRMQQFVLECGNELKM